MHAPPRVGIGIVVRREHSVLIGLRHGAHGSDTWGLPGGHLHCGETFAACAHRELAEECGITITDPHVGTVTNDIFTSEKKHYVTIFVVADFLGGTVRRLEPERCHEWRWCAWNTLPSPLFLSLQHAVDQGFDPFGGPTARHPEL